MGRRRYFIKGKDRWVRVRKIAGAPGAEHERLKYELEEYAKEREYCIRIDGFPDGSWPDVLMLFIEDERKFIFLGDAKDSEHETARKTETRNRIKGYLEWVKKWVYEDENIIGGTICIMTNSEEAAEDWAEELECIAEEICLEDEYGTLEFEVHKKDENTWLIKNVE